MGGVSYAVRSTFGLADNVSFAVPCQDEMGGLCLKNWFPNAARARPEVVITIFELGDPMEPTIPKDGETIDTDQPTLLFSGTNTAQSSEGIYYTLTSTEDPDVSLTLTRSPTPTGNLSWTVGPGALEPGQTYAWRVTDLEDTTLQSPQTFTVSETPTNQCGESVGWNLYVRSMNADDTLPDSEKPLDNQPTPILPAPTCTNCVDCTEGIVKPTPKGYIQCLPQCTDPITCGSSRNEICNCIWSSVGDIPTVTEYGVWSPSKGPSCPNGATCYANAAVQVDTLSFDWGSASNPLLLVAPISLATVTSEPPSPSDGSCVPSLTVPALEGYQGQCEEGEVSITFASATNGGVRFQVYGAGTNGGTAVAIDSEIQGNQVNGTKCGWSVQQLSGGSDPQNPVPINETYKINDVSGSALLACEQSPSVQVGESLCLKAGTPYRVRFDGAIPYLPGPVQVLFALDGIDGFVPLPLNWVSTCALDLATGQCQQNELEPARFRSLSKSRVLTARSSRLRCFEERARAFWPRCACPRNGA